jgi:hypothetical protein
MNEGLMDTFKNAVSRLLGGSVSKLDSLIKRYKENDEKYWKEYVPAHNQYMKARTLYYDIKGELEREKYDEERVRAKKLIDVLEDSKEKVETSIEKQADLIIGGNERLKDYWDLQKARTDEELARSAYAEAKKLTDEKEMSAIFNEIEQRVQASKKRQEELRKTYANVEDWRTTISTPVKDEEPAKVEPVKKEEPAKTEPAKKDEIPVQTAGGRSKEYIEKYFKDLCDDFPEDGRDALAADLSKIYSELARKYDASQMERVKWGLARDAEELYGEKEAAGTEKKPLAQNELNDQISKYEKRYFA